MSGPHWRAGVCKYCTISFNLAGIVTHDGPTEILVSADAKSGRDMAKILAVYHWRESVGSTGSEVHGLDLDWTLYLHVSSTFLTQQVQLGFNTAVMQSAIAAIFIHEVGLQPTWGHVSSWATAHHLSIGEAAAFAGWSG